MATITKPAILTRCSLAAALLTGSASASAQAYTPPPPDLKTGPCVPTKAEPCGSQPAKAPKIASPADQFPFPGEQPKSAASEPQEPQTQSSPGKPQTDSSSGAKPAAGGKFPFPGESPDSSSSSSSSDSSEGPPADNAPDPAASPAEAKPALKDAGSSGSTRFARRKIVAPEDLDHRELEDLEVSRYYISTGSYVAAYKRAQDALKLYPEDENAHIALAIAADKLDKKPEAIAEYHAYLAAAPDGDQAKAARHALELLEPGNSARK